jgi:hypothetical protein
MVSKGENFMQDANLNPHAFFIVYREPEIRRRESRHYI